MLRHEYPQPNEDLVYYTFPIFDSYHHLTCIVSARLGGAVPIISVRSIFLFGQVIEMSMS
jgi:hypothetical protein